MSDEAVAEQVARGDPDRWRSAMVAAAGGAARPDGALRLQPRDRPGALGGVASRCWRRSGCAGGADAIAEIYDGAPPRRHEVTEPLAAAVRTADLPRRLFDEMIAARRADAGGAPLADRAAVDLYIDHTAGHLMELAARHLGAEGAALPVVRDFARGAGTAALLRALPELRARGRDPLPPGVAVGGARPRRPRRARPRPRAPGPGAQAPRRRRCSPAGRRAGCCAGRRRIRRRPSKPPSSAPAPASSGEASPAAGDRLADIANESPIVIYQSDNMPAQLVQAVTGAPPPSLPGRWRARSAPRRRRRGTAPWRG